MDPASNALFWADITTGKIQRSALDGSGQIDLLTGGPALGLAVNTDTATLFFTDQAAGTISSIPIAGGPVTTILGGLSTPSDLVLDLAAGQMYFTETPAVPHRIRRANLDGSGIIDIVTDNGAPIGLVLVKGP